MSQTLEVLRGARALLSDPSNWSRRYYARTANGNNCDPLEPCAASWCADGALIKAAHNISTEEWCDLRVDALKTLADTLGGSVWAFNDRSWHAAVLDLFDRTIAKVEAEQGTPPVTIG